MLQSGEVDGEQVDPVEWWRSDPDHHAIMHRRGRLIGMTMAGVTSIFACGGLMTNDNVPGSGGSVVLVTNPASGGTYSTSSLMPNNPVTPSGGAVASLGEGGADSPSSNIASAGRWASASAGTAGTIFFDAGVDASGGCVSCNGCGGCGCGCT
ncbi:MAG TPA: hypothetical protein VIV60_17120 [Polyangiaceae bacterium]